MYKPSIEESLERALTKLYKKDRKTYEAILKKIEEIVQNPQHYKPLRYSMKGLKRVHVHKSFVLTFKIVEQEKIVKFVGFEHHDRAY